RGKTKIPPGSPASNSKGGIRVASKSPASSSKVVGSKNPASSRKVVASTTANVVENPIEKPCREAGFFISGGSRPARICLMDGQRLGTAVVSSLRRSAGRFRFRLHPYL